MADNEPEIDNAAADLLDPLEQIAKETGLS